MNKTGKVLSASPASAVADEELKQEKRVLKVYIVLQLNKIIFYIWVDYRSMAVITLFLYSLAIFRLNWLQRRHMLVLSLPSYMGKLPVIRDSPSVDQTLKYSCYPFENPRVGFCRGKWVRASKAYQRARWNMQMKTRCFLPSHSEELCWGFSTHQRS